MRGRRSGDDRPVGRPAGLRWLGFAIALTIAGAVTLATTTASASPQTVNAELSLSGIATQANILGGAQIGVHPGDTVNFVPSTIPTAGLTNIPTLGTALDSLLQSILGKGTGYQITMHLPATFPGGKRDVTLGACSPTKNLAVTFPTKGDYTFTWSAVAISPLCLLPADIGSLAGNQLKNAGIALNATNQWVANIHVAVNANPGGISIQLPGVSLAPSLPVVGQLPTIGVPGINLPTLGSVPTLPGGGSTGGSGGGGGLNYTPPAVPIPALVLAHPDDTGFTALNGGFGNAIPTAANGSTAVVQEANGSGASSAAAGKATAPAVTTKQAEQAASATKLTTTQLPVLLAIFAIVALALVTGTYARLYMMRQPG